jgi:hypothetical protein
VLQGFDFARWRPRLILLEDHVGNLDSLALPFRMARNVSRRLRGTVGS